MTSNFNVRDSNWNSDYLYHSVHSDLLFNITDTFNLSFSHPTHSVPTKYLDNNKNSNSLIDLMFLRPNSFKLNNHSIFPES